MHKGTSINYVRRFSMVFYLPLPRTMSVYFYLITSDFGESFWTHQPTLKSDVIDGRSPIVKSIIRKVDGGGGGASGIAQWLWWVGDI